MMRSQLFLFAASALAAAEIPSFGEEVDPTSTTFAETPTAKPASTPTTSYAQYTPIKSIDPWQCATKNISDYLLPPKPTGALLDIYYDHSDAIYKECEEQIPKPFTTYPACPSVAKASWCAVTVPSSNLAEFRAYTSTASSWWAARSSDLPDILDECPNTWKDLQYDIPGGEIWLNATIALADCESVEKVDAKAQSAASPSASQAAAGSQSSTASPSAPAKENVSSLKKMDVVLASLAVGSMLLF